MTTKQNVEYKAGDRIINKGKPADTAYMVVSGTVRVFLEDGGKQITLATLNQSDIFGESAIFKGEKYGAHVEAGPEGAVVFPITQIDFDEMLKTSDPIVRALIRMLMQRLQKTNAALLKSETRELIEIAFV